MLFRSVRRDGVTFADPTHFLVGDEGSLGDTSEAAALRIVESIAGGPDRQRLLVADEYTSDEGGRHPSNLREYTFDGQPTGRELRAGTFEAEAEGVALWSCTPDIGYWV